MPKVPDNVIPFTPQAAPPPEEYLLMAAAVMHEQGRLFEIEVPPPNLKTRIESLRNLPQNSTDPEDEMIRSDAAKQQQLNEKYPMLRNRMRGR